MTTVATLTVEMAANVARLRQDMDRAVKTVDSAMGGITKAANLAGAALGAIGVGLSVSAITGWVRGAINAADQMTKMAQKTGLAVDQVAGLQLAFRQSGVEATQFVPIMAKLSNAAVNGSQALKAMGIESTNAEGSLKSTRELIGEVAGKFASYQDGAAKTALAVKLFGEEGAKLLPLLNQGATGLERYDDMARRLGLTLDKETGQKAEQFNDTLDLIGQSTQGVARQVAAQLLPTLTGLAGQFFNSMTSGDRLRNTAEFLSAAMKGLYVVGLGVVEVFSTVGKTFGGVAAAIAAAASGDFRMAGNILKELKTDIGTGWKTTLEQMQGAWNASGDAGVSAMAAIAGAAPPAIEATKKLGTEASKVAQEYAKLLEDYAKAEDANRQRLFKARMDEEEKAEKEHYEWLKSMDEAAVAYRLKLHDKQLDAQEKAELEAAKALEKIAEKEQEAYIDMWKSVDETARDVFVDVANEGVDAFERIGKTLKAAVLDMLYQMTVRKWIFQIAGVNAGGMGGMGGGGGGVDWIDIATKGYDWFTGGSTAASAYSLAGAGSSGLGLTASAGTGTSLAATGGTGLTASAGTGTTLAATSGGTGLTASGTAAAVGTAAQTGAASGVASGLAAVPVWGWIALAVLALWEPMFGRKIKEVGKAGNFDGAGGIQTSQYTHKQGGWFRGDKTYYDPLDDGGAFQNQLKMLQSGMVETARVMGLGTESIENFAGSVNINLKGLNAEEAAAKTKEELTKLQAQMLASASYAPAVTQSFEEITQAMIEMGYTAEDAAQHAREVTARDDALKRQGFEAMTNYYIDLINQTEETMARAGITSQALADVITGGMTGRLNESQVGAQLADIVLGGIYNTIAGGFAKQISDVFMQQIIQPIMMSVVAGVPLTSAISQQAMATVVATAQNAAAQLTAIFSDPTFRQTMAQLQSTIGSIATISVRPARSVRSFGSAALAAGDAARRAADEQRRLAEQIRQAWQQISDSITDEIRRIRGEILGDTPAGQAYAQAQFAIATAQARSGNQDAAKMLPQLSQAVLRIAEQTATSLGDLRSVQGATLQSLTETRAILSRRFGLQIPAFAAGGFHAGGWAMVGEQGPELAYMPPAQIYNASDTRQMMGGDSVAAEIRELRKEMAAIRRDTARTADNTGLTSLNIDDAVKGRRSIATRAAA